MDKQWICPRVTLAKLNIMWILQNDDGTLKVCGARWYMTKTAVKNNEQMLEFCRQDDA